MLRASLVLLTISSPLAFAFAQEPIPDSLACGRCTVEARVEVRLGATGGPGELPQSGNVALDARGRYWLFFFASEPMVFDSSGRFVTRVGRRGQGPGEFDSATQGFAVGDSMVIVDLSGRITIMDMDLEPVRTVRSRVARPHAAIPVRWPTSVFVSAAARATGSEGWPLHIIDLGMPETRVVRSFGENATRSNSRSSLLLERLLLHSADGTIWSADKLRYRITRWSSDGERLATLTRAPSWFAEASRGGPGGPTRPPEPLIAGISEDSAGRLWIFTRVAAEGGAKPGSA